MATSAVRPMAPTKNTAAALTKYAAMAATPATAPQAGRSCALANAHQLTTMADAIGPSMIAARSYIAPT